MYASSKRNDSIRFSINIKMNHQAGAGAVPVPPRLPIHISNEHIVPGHEASQIIKKIILMVGIAVNAHRWKYVPAERHQTYFDQFTEHTVWSPDVSTEEVQKAFNKMAQVQYKDLMRRWHQA